MFFLRCLQFDFLVRHPSKFSLISFKHVFLPFPTRTRKDFLLLMVQVDDTVGLTCEAQAQVLYRVAGNLQLFLALRVVHL